MHAIICDKCATALAESEEFVEISMLRCAGRPGAAQVRGSKVAQFHVDCSPVLPPPPGEFVPGSPGAPAPGQSF